VVRPLRALASALCAAALAAPVLVATAVTGPSASAAVPDHWIDVSVATLWSQPGQLRTVDAPALSNPADPLTWVSSMTVDQKRWLVGHADSQALYGTGVVVLQVSGAWSRVAVSGQPTPLDSRGYPGWLPTAQLTTTRPVAASHTGVVLTPITYLWRHVEYVNRPADRAIRLSFATRLPVTARGDGWLQVATPDGGRLYATANDVAYWPTGVFPTPIPSRAVQLAERFLGLQYLWAGTSGFGFDCSGYMWAVYSAMGVTIPRDADAQAASGTPVSRANLRPGDLVFFAGTGGTGHVHHVGMYVGNNQMIDSYATGYPVRFDSLSSAPFASEYAGARRYLS
jgi:cell wall-associated NlpC family hydrolase